MIFSKKHGIFTWIRSFGHDCQKSEASRFSTELLLLLCVEPVGNSAYFWASRTFGSSFGIRFLPRFFRPGATLLYLSAISVLYQLNAVWVDHESPTSDRRSLFSSLPFLAKPRRSSSVRLLTLITDIKKAQDSRASILIRVYRCFLCEKRQKTWPKTLYLEIT